VESCSGSSEQGEEPGRRPKPRARGKEGRAERGRPTVCTAKKAHALSLPIASSKPSNTNIQDTHSFLPAIIVRRPRQPTLTTPARVELALATPASALPLIGPAHDVSGRFAVAAQALPSQCQCQSQSQTDPANQPRVALAAAENNCLTRSARDFIFSSHLISHHITSHSILRRLRTPILSILLPLHCTALLAIASTLVARRYRGLVSIKRPTSTRLAAASIHPPARTGPRTYGTQKTALPHYLPLHSAFPSVQLRAVWHMRQQASKQASKQALPPARTHSLHRCLVPRYSRPRLTLRNKA
jgi:hypothetical protein